MVLLLLSAGASRLLAQTEENDLAVNVNGNFLDGENASSLAAWESSLPLANFSSFNTATGLGSFTLTYDPGTSAGAGTSYFIDILDNEYVGTPYYNTFGSTSGSASSGEKWEIGDWWNGSIYTDAQGSPTDALLDANYLLEGATNYFAPVSNTDSACSGDGLADDCNGIAAIALGETFTLTSVEQEVLTFTVASSCGSTGICLASTNPGDSNPNDVFVPPTTVYFSETATEEPAGSGPPPSAIPEPSSWILLATGLIGFGMMRLRREIVQA